MTLGKVIGNVVSTVKHDIYKGHKLLLVKQIQPDGNLLEKYFVALDDVQAGVGDTVIVIDEGNSSRTILENTSAPVRTMVVGIVDHIDKVEVNI